MPTPRPSFLGRTVISCLYLYRNTLSNIMLHSCRFSPTCSQFAIQAIEKYGLVHGGWRTLSRLARCHPLAPGGVDPA